MKYCSLYKEDGTQLCLKASIASNFWSRLRGLLGKIDLKEDEGIILYPSSSIHTFGMKFNIDVLFLDKDKRVLKVVKNMMPGEVNLAKMAYYVIELKSGVIQKKGINVADKIVFSERLI